MTSLTANAVSMFAREPPRKTIIAILECSNESVAWTIQQNAVEMKIFPTDRIDANSHASMRLRKIFSLTSHGVPDFVNAASDSVTISWIEIESSSVQMTRQQELVLA